MSDTIKEDSDNLKIDTKKIFVRAFIDFVITVAIILSAASANAVRDGAPNSWIYCAISALVVILAVYLRSKKSTKETIISSVLFLITIIPVFLFFVVITKK